MSSKSVYKVSDTNFFNIFTQDASQLLAERLFYDFADIIPLINTEKDYSATQHHINAKKLNISYYIDDGMVSFWVYDNKLEAHIDVSISENVEDIDDAEALQSDYKDNIDKYATNLIKNLKFNDIKIENQYEIIPISVSSSSETEITNIDVTSTYLFVGGLHVELIFDIKLLNNI